MGEGETARAPRTRLSEEKRGRFLEVLGQTGNRSLAAEAIGVDGRLMDQRREFDPLLDRQWREALDQADRRLAGADGPLDCIGGAEPMVIRRGAGGQLKLVKAGPKRWSRPVDERFFATLAATGNIAASARSVGFSLSCIAHRRRNVPGFAEKLEQALEDAELEIEFRVSAEARGVRAVQSHRHSRGSGNPDEGGAWHERPLDSRFRGNDEVRAGNDEPGHGDDGMGGGSDDRRPMDLDAAIRFLKWREEKRRGGGRRGRVPREPSADDVAAKIIRKVEAIKRARARDGAEA